MKEVLMLALTNSPTNVLETAPYVLTEQQISPFKFYRENAVQNGMTYGNELYRLTKRFSINNRLEAYRFGCELIGQGIPTIISVSEQHYRVWISLRNPVAETIAAA